MEFTDELKKNEVAVASVTIDGDITAVNQKFIDLTGYSDQQLKSLTFRDISPEKWLSYENRFLTQEVFRDGKSHYQKEYICADGSIIAVALDVFLLRGKEDNVEGMWARVWAIDSDDLPEVDQ